MVRMARGRQLGDSQVTAIANLVAASVPGLAIDAVRIVDQHGRLLSQLDGADYRPAQPAGADGEQAAHAARAAADADARRRQFLERDPGRARHGRGHLGARELRQGRRGAPRDAAAEPDRRRSRGRRSRACCRTPRRPTPRPSPARPPADRAAAAAPPTTGESSATRTYELGREVAVSNTGPGSIKRLSVAVALSKDAMKGISAVEMKKLEQLIGAAVGADLAARRPGGGDRAAVPGRSRSRRCRSGRRRGSRRSCATRWRCWRCCWCCCSRVRPMLKAFTRDKRADTRRRRSARATPRPAARATRTHGGSCGHEAGPTAIGSPRRSSSPSGSSREKPDDALLALRRMLGDRRKEAEAAR